MNGALLLNGTEITAAQITQGGLNVSKADIDAGKLVFKPVPKESGFDGHQDEGVGDQKQDYAHFKYKPTDARNEGDEATFVIDIVPVVDTPSISINRTGLESVREVITKITGETEPGSGGGQTQPIEIIINESGRSEERRVGKEIGEGR